MGEDDEEAGWTALQHFCYLLEAGGHATQQN